jgi:quercetin dioxygenase-like cupin family protein
MTVTAHNTRPDEGARLDMPDGVYIVKASAEETGGAFEVFEVEAPAIPSGPLHRSPWASTIYLLEGNVVIRFEDGQVSLNPGSSITIPSQTACTFDVLGESARILGVTSGDRAGKFFAGLRGERTGRSPLRGDLPASRGRDRPPRCQRPRATRKAMRGRLTATGQEIEETEPAFSDPPPWAEHQLPP